MIPSWCLMRPVKMQNYLLTANSNIFLWISVENSLLSTVTNTNHFTAVLDMGSSDFYGHIFQVMYTLCYKHICSKLAHEHDYFMCTTKSEGPAGHMLTNGLDTCPQLHYRALYASNYKSMGNLRLFFWFYFAFYICIWSASQLQWIKYNYEDLCCAIKH